MTLGRIAFKRIIFFALLGFFVAALYARAGLTPVPSDGFSEADPDPVMIPVRKAHVEAGQVEFDAEFFRQLGLVYNHASKAPNFPQPDRKEIKSEKDITDPNFAIFIEIFKFFVNYANQFTEEREKYYTSIGDFRAYYTHRILEKYPMLSWQIEAYKMTTQAQAATIVAQGGGGGIRVDVHPTPDGTLSFSFLPAYGELRNFNSNSPLYPSGTDFIFRASAGAAYRHKLGKYVEPGVQVFFQPQIIDFTQYRLYVESFIRFKIVSQGSTSGNLLQISEISLVPKVIYWDSTDRSGPIGDPIQKFFGDSYYKLSSNLYGFLNLEFRFKM